jgi:UDP-glucose 4-epimerase
MRAVVTGGAGFIGSHLVEELVALGWQVRVLDDLSTGSLANLEAAKRMPGVVLDIAVMDVCEAQASECIADWSPAVVFHLAAQPSVVASEKDPARDAEVNVVGTARVAEGAAGAGGSFVVYAASGGTLYGEVDEEDLPVPEDFPPRPISFYGLSKKTGIDYLELYRAKGRLRYTALALANVYGPRQDPAGEAGVVAIFLDRLAKGLAPVIYGDGEQTRDFVFVGDTVEAFIAAAERQPDGLVINVGTGERTSVNRLLALIAEVTGIRAEPDYAPPRGGELRHICLDPNRALVRLGWRARTSLAEGIRATAATILQAGAGE